MNSQTWLFFDAWAIGNSCISLRPKLWKKIRRFSNSRWQPSWIFARLSYIMYFSTPDRSTTSKLTKNQNFSWKPLFSTFLAAAILNFGKNVLIPVFWAARSSRDVHFIVKSKRLMKSSFFCILSGGHIGFRQICYFPYFGMQNPTVSQIFPKNKNSG